MYHINELLYFLLVYKYILLDIIIIFFYYIVLLTYLSISELIYIIAVSKPDVDFSYWPRTPPLDFAH